MSRPERIGHESEVRSHRALTVYERCQPLSENQRRKLGLLKALDGLRVSGKRFSDSYEVNVKHGSDVIQSRAFKYGRFVARRLRTCVDKRRVRWLLRRIRIGVGPLRTPARVAFERGYASVLLGPKKEVKI